MTTQLERIKYELELAGFKIDETPKETKIDSDESYTQAIGNDVYQICKMFSEQEHSGYSASIALSLIDKLLIKGLPLSPLTSDPNEWTKCENIYQSKRDFSCFSDDDLKSYYDIDAEENKIYELDENGNKTCYYSLLPVAERKRTLLLTKAETNA